MSELIQQARISVSYEQQGQSPELNLLPPAEDFYLTGDVQRLELALVNVMRNALQAATSEVEISWQQQQDQVEIKIRDDGKGLPQESSDQQPLTTPLLPPKSRGRHRTGAGYCAVCGQ